MQLVKGSAYLADCSRYTNRITGLWLRAVLTTQWISTPSWSLGPPVVPNWGSRPSTWWRIGGSRCSILAVGWTPDILFWVSPWSAVFRRRFTRIQQHYEWGRLRMIVLLKADSLLQSLVRFRYNELSAPRRDSECSSSDESYEPGWFALW